MANPMIKFLRGNQAGFENLGTYEAGVFYLTKDTNRLYIGNDDNTASLLNQGVQVVQNVDALPTAPPAHDGDFIYCIDENVLAYYDGTANGGAGGWTQINPDTRNSEVKLSSAVNTTGSGDSAVTKAVITSMVKDKQEKSDTLDIVAGNNITLTAESDGFKISAVDEKATKTGHYTPVADSTTDKTVSGTGFVTGITVDTKGHIIGVTASEQTTNNVTKVELEAKAGTAANTAVLTSTVTDNVGSQSDTTNFVGGGATSISVANDTITISSTDQSVTNVDNHYKATTGTDDNLANKFAIGVKKDAAGHVINVNGAESKEATEVSSVQDGTNGATMTVNAKTIFGEDKSDTQKFVGAGDNTITVNANGDIVITGTDQAVTAVGYHYTPKDGTAKNVDDKKFAIGVSIDAAGHVTGVNGEDSKEATEVSAAQDGTNGAVMTVNAKNLFGEDKSDTIKIVGGGDNVVTVDTSGNIVITGTDESTTQAGHYAPATEDTSKKKTASGGTVTAAKATTQVITAIKLDAKNHVVGIESAGIKDTDTHNSLKSVDLKAQNGSLITNVTMNDAGDAKSDSIALTINYGEKDTQQKYTASAILTSAGTGDNAAESGKWDLDVYTTAQVDAKIANAVGANGAVQIVGTVNASANPAVNLPNKDIKAGDTYIVTGKGTYNGRAATAGDMFIASADHKVEGAVATDFWYYVPAGNEVITMSAAGNGFALTESSSNTTIGAVEFAAYDATSDEFQVVASVETGNKQGDAHVTSSISFNMYWGAF